MIYFDNAATTRPSEESLKIFYDISSQRFFNPSAAYSLSFNLFKDINQIKKEMINYLGGNENDKLIFTSGATESNNLAIFGSCLNKQKKYLFSMGEHPSVYNCACELKNKGYDVDFIPLQTNGEINYTAFENKCNEEVYFVSIILVNNETGAINNLKKIREILDKKCPNAILHIDAVQGFGKIDFKVNKYNINLCSISAHKIGGIKGIGALYISNSTKIKNINFGGGQENGLRSGTINGAGIFSFYISAKQIFENKQNNLEKVKELKKYLLQKIDIRLKNKIIICSCEENSPYIVSLILKNARGETAMRYLDSKGILIGTGSACSSSKVGNRILESMGYTKKEVIGAIRVSFNANNTVEEIDVLVDELSNFLTNMGV